ncbi:uncharacterized protein M6B38_344645 [Iris pallida]|uniref:DUF3741 domain-containing protein n=1 Tax=Iris pallida TaxID=29817 RepID=A0AAX6GUP4_IRIPA|nr:uncharacterized protein M6B38_344645 [Iris pallida]
MKDLSIFLLKKSLASKMKRGVRSACNGVVSTTTMDQGKGASDDAANVSCVAAAPSLSSGGSYVDLDENNLAGGRSSPKTLEEMLLQLDVEEAAAARRAKLEEYGELNRRMSCANGHDALSSARDALSHYYPRFSLDGRDAMYRSFRNSYVNLEGGRNSVIGGFRGGGCGCGYELDVEKSLRLPPTVAGECVVWCRPGVVARLMGLEAVPVPVPSRSRSGKRLSFSEYRRRSLRRMGRYELEKDRIAMNVGGCKEGTGRESAAAAGHCATRPASMVLVRGGGGARGGRGL